MCLTMSGRIVASGSADDDVGRCRHARLAVLAGHTGHVKCVMVAAAKNDEDRASLLPRRSRTPLTSHGRAEPAQHITEPPATTEPPPPPATTGRRAPRPPLPPSLGL